MRACSTWLITVLLACLALAQSSRQVRYRPILSNDAAGVFALELPPGFRAPSFQNQHDVLWVALDAASVTFLDSERRRTEVRFAPGDVRFFRSFTTAEVVNTGGADFRGLLVQIKKRAAGGSRACGSAVEKSICGCSDARPLPPLWAFGLRNLTVAGTSLGAGEGFADTADRDDMLLIALSALELRDEPARAAAPSPASIRLQPGEAVWIAAGAHRLRNVGRATARFVTVEF